MRLPFLLLFIFTLHSTLAQNTDGDIEVVYGPMFSVDKRSIPTQMVGADEKGIYMVYSRGKDGRGANYLQKFSFDLTPLQEVKLSTKSLRTETEKVLMLDGDLFQIMFRDTGRKRTFYTQPISKENFTLGKVSELGSYTTPKGLVNPPYKHVNIAPDSSYVSLVWSIPSKYKEHTRFEAIVLDRKMEKVWSQRYELPYLNKLLDLQEFRVDKEGVIYALAKRNFDSRRNRVAGKVNYDYVLFRLPPGGDIETLEIETEGNYLRDMKLEFAPDGDIICAGFYINDRDEGAIGAFYLKYDVKKEEVVASEYREFGREVFLQNKTREEADRTERRMNRGGAKELPGHVIDRLIPMSDGSIRMVGEQRRVYQASSAGAGSGSGAINYVNHDIVVVNIRRDGEIEWAKLIGKRQHTVNDGAVYSSYALMKYHDQLTFVFNDNAANLDYKGMGKIARMAKNSATVITSARVTPAGDIERTALFRRGEAEIKIRPSFSYQLNEKELLLFGHRKLKEQRFVILKFK